MSDVTNTMSQLDFTSTLALLLGLPVPYGNVGSVDAHMWAAAWEGRGGQHGAVAHTICRPGYDPEGSHHPPAHGPVITSDTPNAHAHATTSPDSAGSEEAARPSSSCNSRALSDSAAELGWRHSYLEALALTSLQVRVCECVCVSVCVCVEWVL